MSDLILDVTEPKETETDDINDSKKKKRVVGYIAIDSSREPGTVRKDSEGRVWLKVRDD